MEWIRVGEVVHYFGRINVAVIELTDTLQVGDWIGFVKNEEMLFEQEVTSMQINYEDMASASAGAEVALKVDQKVRSGVEVYVAVD
jgi:hypothetical protein